MVKYKRIESLSTIIFHTQPSHVYELSQLFAQTVQVTEPALVENFMK